MEGLLSAAAWVGLLGLFGKYALDRRTAREVRQLERAERCYKDVAKINTLFLSSMVRLKFARDPKYSKQKRLELIDTLISDQLEQQILSASFDARVFFSDESVNPIEWEIRLLKLRAQMGQDALKAAYLEEKLLADEDDKLRENAEGFEKDMEIIDSISHRIMEVVIKRAKAANSRLTVSVIYRLKIGYQSAIAQLQRRLGA